MVPGKGLTAEVAVFLPANDVALRVVGTGVGRIHGRLVGAAAVAVVGQRGVDPALLVHGNPLGAIHLGGAQQVAGLAGLDQHFALVGKAVGGCERAFAMRQRNPAALAVGVELGHVQRAMVQQRGVGCGATGLDGITAHELVDVLKACVFAHVDHGPVVTRDGHRSAFVRTPAHGRALDGGGAGVVGVDLDDPAEAVGLVGVLGGVKPRVKLMPAVARATLLQAPALFVGTQRVATAEVVDEVFFRREVRTPGRDTAGAVVEGAQHRAPVWVGCGFHERVTCGGAADQGGRVGSDAASPGRGSHHFPLAVLFLHFADRYAVGSLRLAHLLQAPVGSAVGEQQAVVHILVVHGQQAHLGAFLRKVVDAVVVHAKLGCLLGGAVAGVVLERSVFTRHAHRVTPGCDHLHGVALGHRHRVGRGKGHALEAQQGASTRARGGTTHQRSSTGHRAQRRQKIAGQRAQTATQQGAARRG